MDCQFCQRATGHSSGCPASLPVPDRKAAKAAYHLGWTSGRAGFEPESSFKAGPDEAWKMGWVNGTSALEEAENGFQPGVDGGQW
jgi:hypothetical protein